ncbi:hypothetical protein BJ742DRAFT_785571 [Cladochytrium replicatum]|nr:hypothetical protein BJ742DRAFT_785571 [Cladochytrium replicatum]
MALGAERKSCLAVIGRVSSKREHRNYLFLVLESAAWLNDSVADTPDPPTQIVVTNNSTLLTFSDSPPNSPSDDLRSLIIPLCDICVKGTLGTTKAGHPSLFASQITLLRAPQDCDRETILRALTLSLSRARDASVSTYLVTDAATLTTAWDAISRNDDSGVSAHVSAICKGLASGRVKPPLPQRIRGRLKHVLEKWESRMIELGLLVELEVAEGWSEEKVWGMALEGIVVSHVLKNIPHLGDERRMEYLEKKKLPQVMWMVQQISALAITKKNDAKLILDVGGGRGDLAIALSKALPDFTVVVLDSNGPSLEAGQALATQENVADRMIFLEGDARDPVVLSDIGSPSIVTALHACGGLADLAMEIARRNRASCLICTCCFRSNTSMGRDVYRSWVGSKKQPSQALRVLEELGIRDQIDDDDAAEDVVEIDEEDIEMLSWEEFKLIQRLALSHGHPDVVARATQIINSLRLRAARDVWDAERVGKRRPDVRLLHFPRSYSPCNQVVCVHASNNL